MYVSTYVCKYVCNIENFQLYSDFWAVNVNLAYIITCRLIVKPVTGERWNMEQVNTGTALF